MNPGGPRLPNLVIAGVSKAGTTSLFWYLGQHPEVCPADHKELRYFTPLKWGQPLGPIEDYGRHFARCGGERYAMEATPGYFSGGAVIAEAMERVLEQPRVIVSLRDPVERLWSYYRFLRTKARIDKTLSFDDYVDTSMRLRENGLDRRPENTMYAVFGAGFYGDYLDEWFDVFGSRLEVVFFEHIVAAPEATVSRLCGWLDIDTGPARTFTYSVENRTVPFRSKPLQQLALTANRRWEPFFNRHRILKRRLRNVYYSLNRGRDDATLAPDARRRLAHIYAPSVEVVSQRLTHHGVADLPSWLRPTTSGSGLGEPDPAPPTDREG